MTDNLPAKRPARSKQLQVDGLVNVVSGLGTAKSKRSHNQWFFDLLNNFQELDAAYQSNWIARKICDIPAEDMTREWRRINSDKAEEIAELEQALCVPNQVQEALTWARLYGGSGILMITGQDLTKPLNLNKVKKGDLQRLLVFDRWDMQGLTLNTWDVLAANYLKPEFYTIRGGSMQVHWTHFARFNGERLPRRWMEQTQGWGDSVLRKCIEEVADMVAAKGGIAELMQEANIDVITREGLNDELSTDQDDAIVSRYQLFSQMKSVFNMALLDGDEKLDRQTLNLSGVAAILEQFLTWISGSADIPVTRMFGTSAKGMNATGEGDDRNYNNSIRAKQRKDMTEPLRTLDEVLVRSALGTFPDSYDYTWNPLSLPTDLESAQSEQLRSQKHQTYSDMGVVTTSQIQRELQAIEEYQFQEHSIEELEKLEYANMFEELPTLPEPSETLVTDAHKNNGFASVKLDINTARRIDDHLKSLGIKNSILPNKMHVTLMYSKNDRIDTIADNKTIYSATVKGLPSIMGNDPYRALFVGLDSDELLGRNVELMLAGGVSDFPNFIPHLSLKYSPTDGDLQLLIDNPLDIGELLFTGETFKPVK